MAPPNIRRSVSGTSLFAYAKGADNATARRPVIRGAGPCVVGLCRWSAGGGTNLVGLRALLALRDFELDPLTLVEALIAVLLDGAVVDEDVRPAVDGDEAEPL